MSVTFALRYPAETPEELEVNLSNANAARVLRELGYAEFDELIGSVDADDLAARCLLLIAAPPLEDAGVPDLESGGPGYGVARVIECGLRPGYYSEVAARLHALTDAARSAGCLVQFC